MNRLISVEHFSCTTVCGLELCYCTTVCPHVRGWLQPIRLLHRVPPPGQSDAGRDLQSICGAPPSAGPWPAGIRVGRVRARTSASSALGGNCTESLPPTCAWHRLEEGAANAAKGAWPLWLPETLWHIAMAALSKQADCCESAATRWILWHYAWNHFVRCAPGCQGGTSGTCVSWWNASGPPRYCMH